MRPKYSFLFFLTLAGVLMVTGCGESAPALPSPTLDPCSGEYLPTVAEQVNALTRSFNEIAVLAADIPRDELNGPIAELQRIRRAAEDQGVPACLKTLKEKQLAHMNAVIQTLIAFVAGADQETVSEGVALSQQLNNEYLLELARLLGVTISVPATPVPFLP